MHSYTTNPTERTSAMIPLSFYSIGKLYRFSSPHDVELCLRNLDLSLFSSIACHLDLVEARMLFLVVGYYGIKMYPGPVTEEHSRGCGMESCPPSGMSSQGMPKVTIE